MKKGLWVVALLVVAGLWYQHSKDPSSRVAGGSGAPWEEVSIADFDAKVLQSPERMSCSPGCGASGGSS